MKEKNHEQELLGIIPQLQEVFKRWFVKIKENNFYFKKSYIGKQYHDLRISQLERVFTHQDTITTGVCRNILGAWSYVSH